MPKPEPSGPTPFGVAGVEPRRIKSGVEPRRIKSGVEPRRMAPVAWRHRLIASSILALAAQPGLLLTARPAAAQYGGLLPNLGGNPQITDIRPQLERYFKPEQPTSSQPQWVIQPSIEVDVGATDNAQLQSSGKKGDIFTNILPSLVVNGDTSHVTVNLGYSPTITRYLSNSNLNTIGQNGSGQALITFVPDTLFLDLRGNASVQSGINGFVQPQSQVSSQQYNVQTTTISATPYAEHRFGGWGTARVGFSIARTMQNTPYGQTQFNNTLGATAVDNLAALQAANNTQGYGALGNLTTKRERASFTSGENLGRFNDMFTVEANQFSGGGSYVGAYRNEVQNELGFAFTRTVTLLGGLGYQDIYYAGFPAVRINEPTYNFGLRYNPSPDTSITMLYGRRDGAPAITFDGQVAPTARTRLVVRYSTGITSDAENSQNVLDSTSTGATGQLVDTVTGAPVGAISGYGGVQNGVYRVRRLSANGSLLQERDTFSAGLTSEERTTLTNTIGYFGGVPILAGTVSNTTYATLAWQHDLSPDMQTSASVQYGITNNPAQLGGAASQTLRTFSFTAALSRQFTQTLSGSVQYIFNDQTGAPTSAQSAFNTGNYTQNTLLVSLRKGF
jgi:uncharacterized protein (PEP-CTERM system associated)